MARHPVFHIVIISIPNFTETDNCKAYTNIFSYNTQSEATLWKLKFFVKDLLQAQGKSPRSIGGGNNTINNNVNQNKRKFVTNDTQVRPTLKKSKKA